MLGVVLLILKFVFLLLLYLFLALIIFIAYRDTRGASGVAAGEPARRSSPRLIILESPQEPAGKVFVLGDETVIGRSKEADIVLNDTFASSRHARLTQTSQGLSVEDLGSRNGTFVGEQRVHEPVYLKSGSRLKVGKTVLEFLE